MAIADAGVLELALELGVLRGGVEVIRGRVPLSDLPVWLAMNAGARGTLVFIGGNSSNGIEFLFTVIYISSNNVSASLPLKPNLVTLTNIK